MAIMNLKFNCGCGFSTLSASGADDHSEVTGHKMEVLGTVVPETVKPRVKKSVFRAPSPDYVPPKGYERGER